MRGNLSGLQEIQRALDNIDLHDRPVDAIRFDLSEATVEFHVRAFDEADEAHDVTMMFHEAADLHLQDNDLLRVEEIHRGELTPVGDRFKLVLVLLCGFGGPSLQMSFTFGTLSLKGWPHT